MSSLAIHATVNELGFLETPYKKVVNGVVTDQIDYLSAEKEDNYILIPASTAVDKNGKIIESKIRARKLGDFVMVDAKK